MAESYEFPKDKRSGQLKKFTDADLKKLPESELRNIIDSREGEESDRVRYISAWIDKHFRNNVDRIVGAKMPIIDSILSYGIEGNNILIYIDRFLSKTKEKLFGDYLLLVEEILSSGIADIDTDWLYDDWLYNESEKNNIYKLKSILFVADNRNVRYYDLRNTSGKPLTVSDILGKSSEEMLKVIDESQKRNFDYTDETFETYGDGHKEDSETIFSYYSKLIKKLYPEESQNLIEILNRIEKSEKEKTNFLQSDIDSKRIKEELYNYLSIYNNKKSNKEASADTIGSWLNSNNIQTIDVYNEFKSDISNFVSKNKASRYKEYLLRILETKNLRDKFLSYKIKDNTRESVVSAIISFLDSFNEVVKKKNLQDRNSYIASKSSEPNQLLKDVEDLLIQTLKLPRPEVQKYIFQVYTPGMTEDEIIRSVLQNYGKVL